MTRKRTSVGTRGSGEPCYSSSRSLKTAERWRNEHPAEDPPKTIEILADAVYPSFAMLAGMELDVFTPLKEGRSLRNKSHARRERIQPRPRLSFMRWLPSVCLNSMETASLTHRKQISFSFAAAPITSGCGITLIGVDGIQCFVWRRPFARACHNAGWTTPVCLPTRVESFYRGTFTECLAAGRVLARSRDFSDFQSLVDVGGGSGGLAIAMAETWPNLTITIADLPAIMPVAQRYADEAGFATRIKVCPTNVVSDPLSGSYDIAMMRGLFPVLTGDQIRSVLANVYSALKPGSPLYVVGWILDNSRTAPLSYATYNLLFVNDYADSLIHTEGEHRSWLEEAGFEYVLREPSAPSYAADFILARKP